MVFLSINYGLLFFVRMRRCQESLELAQPFPVPKVSYCFLLHPMCWLHLSLPPSSSLFTFLFFPGNNLGAGYGDTGFRITESAHVRQLQQNIVYFNVKSSIFPCVCSCRNGIIHIYMKNVFH